MLGVFYVFASSFLYLGIELFLLNQVAILASSARSEVLLSYVVFLVFNGLGTLIPMPKEQGWLKRQYHVCLAILALWLSMGVFLYVAPELWLDVSLTRWFLLPIVLVTALVLGFEFMLTLKIGQKIFGIDYARLIGIDFIGMFCAGLLLFLMSTRSHLLTQWLVFATISLSYTLFAYVMALRKPVKT